MERWITHHQRLILSAIVLLSVLLRVGYYFEIAQGPCVWQHRWEQSDMNFYDLWARDIVAGDWLSKDVSPPYHLWHQTIAAAHFELHPEASSALLQEGVAAGNPANLGRALWSHWLGDKTFYQEPLYPYLLALTYKAFGTDVRWVFLWQLLLGVLINVLVYLLARRYFGVVVATIAGGLTVFCSPLMYYNMILLRETLITFMGLLLVYLTDLALVWGTWRWWLLTGLACGLAVLLKTTFLLFCLGVFGLLAYQYLANPRVMLRFGAALVGGLIICMIPLMARNIAVGVSPLKLPSGGAITFINSNAKDFQPEWGFFSSQHASRIMGDNDGRFLPAIVATLKTHATPWDYLKLLWGKFAVMWHWYEIPNNANFYYYQLHSSVLRYTPFTFSILGPFIMLGLVIAVWRRIPCYPLYLLVLSNILIMIIFYVISRFRVPFLATSLPFAALTIVQIVAWIKNKQIALSIGSIAAYALLSLWTMRPLSAGLQLIRPVDYLVPYRVHYSHLLKEAREKQDWVHVAEILKGLLRYEPTEIKRMSPSRLPKNSGEANLGLYFGRIHEYYAKALQITGRKQAAIEHNRRANELLQIIKGEN